CSSYATQIHHIKPQALGGKHEPANLQPLCAEHHALEHLKERQKLWSVKR
ncbi:HNH endonuclease, partial [Candidatus Peregrinibacteria bacterium]|nr:HNH endonuclease [Candidatus Peregrinibacteria bacterium]